MIVVAPAENSVNVLIELHQGENTKALKISEMVQRGHYEKLREQITAYIDSLDDAKRDLHLPSGSGWTQFIDGSRGAGKSTFLQSVRGVLKDDSSLKTKLAFIAVIDPSRIEQGEIILLVMLQRLSQRVEDVLKAMRSTEQEELRARWRKAFKGVAGGLSLFAQGYHPLNDLDPELFLDWGMERTGDSTSLREKLHHLFETACSILGVKVLMFGFDDADTDATHAINLLECIRKYLDTPRLMVLVTGDMELYSLLVSQHFAKTVAGKREAAMELARNAKPGDRSGQYLRMIDHLEEQYLLKLFPVHRRLQLQPLWNIAKDNANCEATFPGWGEKKIPVEKLMRKIVQRGLRIKSASDITLYTEFLLKQPLRSVLQILSNCALHLDEASVENTSGAWSEELTEALNRALRALALTSFYKHSINTDALAAKDLDVLTQAVFDLSLEDGDLDTAPYLRPMSARQDIKAGFAALAAEVPNLCAEKPGAALRYLLRAPGSVSLYNLASSHLSNKDSDKDSENSQAPVYRFKSYMGIGRQEDSLDWARRATAVIALPYSGGQQQRVVLPGVVGIMNQKGKTAEISAQTAIGRAVASPAVHALPVFALGMVIVVNAPNSRTYGSIFTLLGLIEKLLSAGAHSVQDAETVFYRAYPTLTISGPNWMRKGADSTDEFNNERSSDEVGTKDAEKQTALWNHVKKWLESLSDLIEETTPSGIFLGKVWTRLFFSLQNAADDLRSSATFDTVMEIFALCAINAFWVEESEQHLSASSPTSDSHAKVDRKNPKNSAGWFVEKLTTSQPRREDFPYTAIMATCPLLLGLLDSQLGYAKALHPLFAKDTQQSDIQALLCPKELKSLMNKVSVTGESRRRGSVKATSSGEKPKKSPNETGAGDADQ